MKARGPAPVVPGEDFFPVLNRVVLEIDADNPERVLDVPAEQVGRKQALAVAEKHVRGESRAQKPQQSQIEHQPDKELAVQAVAESGQGEHLRKV